MDYRDKLILAPMVRVGTLPLRLLAADYGADITYTDEIIDHKLIKCERQINDALGTIDVIENGTGSIVFRTCAEERNRVVLQMGTSDAVRALSAAQIVCKDVAAVDINMGCPKAFSTSGGMGSALLAKPELIHDILSTLKRNLDTPITCKIRLLKSSQDTVELARRIEKTGVSAVAVHGRKVADRPRDPAKWNEIEDVVAALSIPVIANGDVFEFEDIARIKVATAIPWMGIHSICRSSLSAFLLFWLTISSLSRLLCRKSNNWLKDNKAGASSVMIARGALWNASIFSPSGEVSWEDVKSEYVRKAILWDNDVKSTKYTVREMINHHSCIEFPEGKALNKTEILADIAHLYGQDKYYEYIRLNRRLFDINLAI